LASAPIDPCKWRIAIFIFAILATDKALSYGILLLWDPFLRSRARFNRYFEDYIAPRAVLDYKKSIAKLQCEFMRQL
jgi:hypothetical protein